MRVARGHRRGRNPRRLTRAGDVGAPHRARLGLRQHRRPQLE